MAGLNYRDLLVWQKARALVSKIYLATESWPSKEGFGLVSQVRRAAISIPSNIAEGQGRGSAKEFQHHLHFAYGSLMELETQLLLAQDVGYVSESEVLPLLAHTGEIGKLLNGLLNSLGRTPR